MRGKSNIEVSKSKSERLNLDLVLGKVIQNSSLQCSDISLTKIVPSEGKEIFMTNLCILLALQIILSGSKIYWKDFALLFLLVLFLPAANVS